MDMHSKRSRRKTKAKENAYSPEPISLNTNGTSTSSMLTEKHDIVQGSARYERQARLLPEIEGVHALTKTEMKRDCRKIEEFAQSLEVEEDIDEDEISTHVQPVKKRARFRNPGKILPEELIATLPACRSAVHITRAELTSVAKEREELETLYLNLRSQFMRQIEEMHVQKIKQDKVLQVIRKKVSRTAAQLDSRKRRNTAMQDILVEIDARGESLVALRHENNALRGLLKKNDVYIPEIEAGFALEDIVDTPYGQGTILSLRKDGTCHVSLKQGMGYLRRSVLELVESPRHIEHDALKSAFLKKAGAWTDAESQHEVDESRKADEDFQGVYSDDDDDGAGRPLIDFTSNILPITPRNVPLLLSPLSELPEKVAAFGTNSLQWLPSCLPQAMNDWETERMTSLAQQGEIIRLRVQLQAAEASKKEANRQVADQIDAMNHLVVELQNVRAGLPAPHLDTFLQQVHAKTTTLQSRVDPASGTFEDEEEGGIEEARSTRRRVRNTTRKPHHNFNNNSVNGDMEEDETAEEIEMASPTKAETNILENNVPVVEKSKESKPLGRPLSSKGKRKGGKRNMIANLEGKGDKGVEPGFLRSLRTPGGSTPSVEEVDSKRGNGGRRSKRHVLS